MGYRIDFTENQEISGTMLTEAAETLGTGEVSFTDSIEYGVDDLNEISKAIITKGVANGCNVSLNGTKVTISQGTAFFEDGRKIIIDTNGADLTIERGNEYFVCFKHDEVTGYAAPVCTTKAPSGDYVMLARISANGTVTPAKDTALMKNASLLPNSYISVSLNLHSVYTPEQTGTCNVGGNYRRMVLRSGMAGAVYYNWDTGKMYRYGENGSVGTTLETPISDEIMVRINNTTYVSLISFENNILTYRTNAASNRSGSCTIDCM